MLLGQRPVYAPKWVYQLSCYVDSDFRELLGSEDPRNTLSVKSRTGNISKIGNVRILWVSELQSQMSISTMEAEYNALSNSTYSTSRVIKEIYSKVLQNGFTSRCSTHSKAFFENIEEENPASVVYEDKTTSIQFPNSTSFLLDCLTIRSEVNCLSYKLIFKRWILIINLALSKKVLKSKKVHYGMANAQKH